MPKKPKHTIEDILAMFDPEGVTRPVTPAPVPQVRPAPAQRPAPTPVQQPVESPFGFVEPNPDEGLFEKIPAAPVTPVAPVSQPARPVSPTRPAPAPAPAQAPRAPNLPAHLQALWDPSWSLPQDEDEPEFTPEQFGVHPGFTFVDFPAPKPVPVEDLSDPDDAMDYLLNLEGSHPALNAVAIGIREATEAIMDGDRKTIADALGFVIGSLQSLIQTPALGKDKVNIENAAQALREHFSKEVRKLPKEFQERVNKQMLRQVEGPKPRQLQHRSSQYHGENTIYSRNRSIQILRDEDISVGQAEEQANDEWNRIVEVVREGATKFDDAGKQALQTLFAKKVLGDGDFDRAEHEVRDLMTRGPDPRSSEFYREVDVNISADDALEHADELADRELVRDEIDKLPPEYMQKLGPMFVEFGKLAKELIKLGADWQNQVELTGGAQTFFSGKSEREAATEGLKIQQMYNRAIGLSIDIASTPTEIKTQAFAGGDIFKNVYVLQSQINGYAEALGMETLESSEDISGADLVASGLSIFDPSKKHPPKGDAKNRFRKKETEDAARARFLYLIKTQGKIGDYYKKRREYFEGPVRRRTPEEGRRGEEGRLETKEEYWDRTKIDKEKRRMRNNDSNRIKREANKWKEAALTLGEPEGAIKSIEYITNLHRKIDARAFKEMARSWLTPEDISQMNSERLADRKSLLLETYYFLVRERTFPKLPYPIQLNYYVMKGFENHIKNIQAMWDEAKANAPKVVPESEMFEPGIWTEDALRSKRLASTLFMTGIFCKYTSVC